MVPDAPIILGIPIASSPLSLLLLGPAGFEQISCDCLLGTAVLELTYLTVIAIIISGDNLHQLLLQYLLIQTKIASLPYVFCGRPSGIFVLLLCHGRSSNNGIPLILLPISWEACGGSPIAVPYYPYTRGSQPLPTVAHRCYILVYPLVGLLICEVEKPYRLTQRLVKSFLDEPLDGFLFRLFFEEVGLHMPLNKQTNGKSV